LLTEKLARQETRAIKRAKRAMTDFTAIARRLEQSLDIEHLHGND
jgi:hypothetical protein